MLLKKLSAVATRVGLAVRVPPTEGCHTYRSDGRDEVVERIFYKSITVKNRVQNCFGSEKLESIIFMRNVTVVSGAAIPLVLWMHPRAAGTLGTAKSLAKAKQVIFVQKPLNVANPKIARLLQ